MHALSEASLNITKWCIVRFTHSPGLWASSGLRKVSEHDGNFPRHHDIILRRFFLVESIFSLNDKVHRKLYNKVLSRSYVFASQRKLFFDRHLIQISRNKGRPRPLCKQPLQFPVAFGKALFKVYRREITGFVCIDVGYRRLKMLFFSLLVPFSPTDIISVSKWIYTFKQQPLNIGVRLTKE